MHLNPPVVLVFVYRSKAIVLLLLIRCLLLLPLFTGFLCLVLVLLCSTYSVVSSFANISGEEGAGCFTLIVFMLSSYC